MVSRKKFIPLHTNLAVISCQPGNDPIEKNHCRILGGYLFICPTPLTEVFSRLPLSVTYIDRKQYNANRSSQSARGIVRTTYNPWKVAGLRPPRLQLCGFNSFLVEAPPAILDI
ncbi:hypothetical protein RRG08_016156 [Elysia crispata]|uniref:Uncharacterized protein n=1 Tax=Elysia crispata TaxID=231223 RepID=A0AAE0Z2N7_9GAST|nr:hypothetical protein RRG08_016156 [Elysia crispata]